jgi:hypothetical protein
VIQRKHKNGEKRTCSISKGKRKKQNILRFTSLSLLCKMTTQKTSDFYWACRNGDMNIVKKMLPNLKSNDINRIESNGSTALHAASYYGHANIVRLLLERGADTTIRNKYEKTAKEEASTDEVHSVFESTVKIEEADDDDDDMPQSEFVQLYPNAEGMDKSALATRILKARLSTYNAHKYTISAASNLEHLEKKYRKLCEETGHEDNLRMGEEYFKKYRETGDFSHMLQFYTVESPFYRMIQGDETFLVEMYKHLLQYDKYTFQGRTYRSASFSREDDLQVYQWALAHPRSLLEMRKMIPTTQSFQFLQSTLGQRPFLEIDFAEQCFTAIDTNSWSEYPDEEEILVLSGTFFEVTQIRETNDGLTIISLKNVAADKKALSAIN